MVKVRGLTKIYKTPFKNRDGFLSALKFLFSPTYKNVVAVNNINMNIEAGDIHALIGPNGAGKSTIIKVLSGVLYPTDGMVEVLGYIPWKERTAYVKNIGVLFGQKSQLYWEPPALDTYTLYKEIYNIPYQLYKKNLDYLVELFDIGDIVRKPVRNLSLGERMRCEFLCSLLHEPQLVILDEPTIGLDIVSKDIMRDLIRRINKEKRTTFILTTHDVSDIVNLCKNVTIINHGSIVFQDTLQRLKTYFSNTKDIELTFFKKVPQELIEHFKIKLIDSQTGNISIDLKNGSYSHQVTKILKYLPVDDINVLPTNTESIIKDIYQQKKYCQYK